MQDQNGCTPGRPDFEKLDAINDELHCIARLLEKPDSVMSAPEIMDVIRMATDRVMSQYHDIAFQMRVRVAICFQ